MQVRRIGPDGAFLRNIGDINNRVKSLETKPSGNVAIRQQMTTTDPTTGVKTVFGQQADGSYGIKPFVGDTTPPPVATAPIVSAQPGQIIVSWNGNFVAGATKPNDFVHVNVWAHKIVSGITTLSLNIGVIRLSTENVQVSTDIIAIGETWEFSLESEDYNGNVAAKSTRSSLTTMQSNVDSGVTSAILASSNGKNSNYYQPTMPTGGTYVDGDLWYDTDDGFKLYVYSSGTWTLSLLGHQAFATLDAGKIVVGEMDGVHIAAKTITTDKMVITSTDNLILEANFNNAGFSWDLGANNTINSTAGRGSLPAMRFTGTTSAVVSVNKLNKISVGTEDRFRGAIWAKSDSALASGTVKLRARAYTDATTYTSLTIAENASAFVAGTWKNISGISPVLPAGTIALEFFLEVTNNATGTITDIDYVSVTRAADASLVVDGAIDGKTITGATIRTATSGARVEMDTSGLRAYNSSGSEYLTANSSGLTMRGALESVGVTQEATPVAMSAILSQYIIAGRSWNPVGLHFVRSDETPDINGYMPPYMSSSTGKDLQLSSGYDGGAINPPESTLDLMRNSATLYNRNLVTLSVDTMSTTATVELTALNGHVNLFGGTEVYLRGATVELGDKTFVSDVNVNGTTVDIYGTNGVTIGATSPAMVKINNREVGYASFLEYHQTQTSVPDATLWGPGTPSAHSRSTNTGIAHWSASDTLYFDKSGIYVISYTVDVTVTGGVTARTFCGFSMSYDTIQISRASMTAGEDTTTSVATVRVNSGETVTFNMYQTSGGSRTINSRIRITRISDI